MAEFETKVINLLTEIKSDTSEILASLKQFPNSDTAKVIEAIDIGDMNVGFVDDKLDQILEFVEGKGPDE